MTKSDREQLVLKQTRLFNEVANSIGVKLAAAQKKDPAPRK